MNKNNLGWFHISEMWNLYMGGKLKEVHVDFINVDEEVTGDDYIVKHFDQSGDLITTLSLTDEDIQNAVDGLEPTDRPSHI